jgi:hypothetical protein
LAQNWRSASSSSAWEATTPPCHSRFARGLDTICNVSLRSRRAHDHARVVRQLTGRQANDNEKRPPKKSEGNRVDKRQHFRALRGEPGQLVRHAKQFRWGTVRAACSGYLGACPRRGLNNSSPVSQRNVTHTQRAAPRVKENPWFQPLWSEARASSEVTLSRCSPSAAITSPCLVEAWLRASR